MSTQDNRTQEKAKRRRLRAWNIVAPHLDRLLKSKLGFTHDDFEPADIDGPVIVAINHTCAYDPFLVAAAFKNKPLTFVASEHLMRIKYLGAFADRYASIIPHRKGDKAGRAALTIIKRIRRGESVFIATEGEQTWDGVSMPVTETTGKLVKASGATLVTYRIEGGYLAQPRWASNRRKGTIYGHPAGVYSPEMLAAMSEAEIDDTITRDLHFDIWDWQKSRPEGPVKYICAKGGPAEGLEKAVCSCPECGRIGELYSRGSEAGCSCGFKVRFDETGMFEPARPFETIVDWEKHDFKVLSAYLDPAQNDALRDPSAVPELLGDDGATLFRVDKDHNQEQIASGRLSLTYKEGKYSISVDDTSFELGSIINMTMVLSNRIVFSDDDGYYEINSGGTNLRKYVIAREIALD